MKVSTHSQKSYLPNKKQILLAIYCLFILLPIYWLVIMSFKTNEEILGQLTLWPAQFTFDNYITIFTDASWYMGYVNSMIYVFLNMSITLIVALPAAYATLILLVIE
jgi:glycerol transport system permease protein